MSHKHLDILQLLIVLFCLWLFPHEKKVQVRDNDKIEHTAMQLKLCVRREIICIKQTPKIQLC